MATAFNVRIKNAGTDDVQYTAIQSLQHQAMGHLDPGERDDYTFDLGRAMAAGNRVFTVFGTFPPAVKFSKTIDVNHDFMVLKITDTDILVIKSALAPGAPPDFPE